VAGARSASIVADHPERVVSEGLGLARQHDLAVHHGADPDLVLREGLSLATPDERPAVTARRAGVPRADP
jgi:hypothetical protein